MLYRRFPLIDDLDISALGFGCMRLPVLGGDDAAIDEATFDAMLRAAAEAGVNYLDTAYVYHKQASEGAIGAALERTGLRGRFLLATKSPVWKVESREDWRSFLDTQLERLKSGHIDFYLIHALNRERWAKAKSLGVLDFLNEAKAEGLVRHVGFSFHDSLGAFKEIAAGWDGWEFCQIQYNYVDRDYQAGEEGLAFAAERELGVIVMEPLRGGALVAPPPLVRSALAAYPTPRMPAEWALRFALDRQEVTTVLSGMGSVSQMWENVAVADSARANSLTAPERAALEAARAAYKAREKVGCTTCGYCMPCPSGVAIPDVFSNYNTAAMFDARASSGSWYRSAVAGSGQGGDACVRCGECLSKCPQGIAIPEKLMEAHAYLVAEA